MKNSIQNIIGLKELRQNTDNYINKVRKGKTFIIVRKSKPIFKISSPLEDTENWETAVDFTKIKKDGISARELLSKL